ncbi:MAG: NUDIX hydrolase [Magnetococcales bacterium]|nr:NUDIX hydrolase [Magnetococcales bacterium]MBF0260796.1 NUDIX hydrolase [Magnetococcales bacterium]
MTSYPAYYYRQSAVIPVRGEGEALRVLLISSRSRSRWIIPKGIVEPNLTPADSAAKEAFEEAGIRGRVHPEPIGEYDYPKWGGTCVAEVYVMRVDEVLDRWLESFRERVWLTLEEAIGRIQEEKLQEIMRGVPDFLSETAP